MADIKKELNAIKNAVYGREVRSSIHDGIKKINDEVENATDLSESAKHQVENIQEQVNNLVVSGDSSVEAAQARVDKDNHNYSTLKERLDTEQQRFETQLAGMATKEEIKPLEDIRKHNVNAKSPIITPTYDGSYQTVHPKVLHFPGGWNGRAYWMAITPYTNTDDKTENPSILVSNDGYYWYEPEGIDNPISGIPNPDGYGHYSDPHLVMVGNTMECWYRYNPPNADDTANDNHTNIIYRQTTTDGVNWTPKEEMLRSTDPSVPYVSPSLIYEDGKYKMWWHDYSGGMYYQESTNGFSWSQAQTVNVPLPSGYRTWHSDIIRHTGFTEYEMVVSCRTPNSDGYELFYAQSNDGGINFDRGVRKLIEPTRGTDRLDNKEIYRSSIVRVGSDVRIYYSATNSNRTWYTFLTEGKSIDTLQGYNAQPILDKVLNGDLVIKKGKRIYLDDEKKSYIYSNGDRLEIIDNDGRLQVTKSGVGTIYLDHDGIGFNSQKSGSYYKDGAIKLQKDGVGAVIAKFDSRDRTLTLRNGADTNYGFLELGALLLSGSYSSLGNVEGALHYNKSKKKLEFYDGSEWREVSSS